MRISGPGLNGWCMGVAEIAHALGVSRQTVAQWHARGQLPEPQAQLAMGPVWRETTIQRWAKESGRQWAKEVGK